MPGGSINLGHVVGPGVPTGGTVGQVMRKKTGTDYDTEWHSLDDADILSSAVSGQTTVEGALGSLSQQIGDLTGLETAAKTSLVNALNEVNSNFNGVKIITAGQLTTTGDTITPNIVYWFSEVAPCLATDSLLVTLIMEGEGTNSVSPPRTQVYNGSFAIGFLSSTTYNSSVRIGFSYAILRKA